MNLPSVKPSPGLTGRTFGDTIRKLNSNKASLFNCIPARILKENPELLFNSGLSKGASPEELKAGDISSLFKKEDAFTKKNYRPITFDLMNARISRDMVTEN